MLSKAKTFWQNHFFKWIDRRQPRVAIHQLHRRNLYIFPTFTGFSYLILVLIIWLLGTNYQNNLILALAYMQISVFVLTILNTYNNMAGLRVEFVGADEGFAGEKVAFKLLFRTSNSKGTHYITAQWIGQLPVILDFEPNQEHLENVYAQGNARGWLNPHRLLLKSTFPMGLLRCWTWLPFDAGALIYPTPLECDLPAGTVSGDDEQGTYMRNGSGDEFAGFREYKPGDSPKHIAWKQYARDRGLWSKEYGDMVTSRTWLQWEDFLHGDRELALSEMCYWVLRLTERQREFGLRLPGAELPPGSGPDHQKRALQMLALFDTVRQ